ncbi:tryptorubin family RiPP precursor [Streptomyces sp. NPDC057010]|uniref:tryptorubin family RiPP precursor n=1 Tax=Streptomyces sp. NPDC057010 TaxID=3345997 RepID=UPI00362D38E1
MGAGCVAMVAARAKRNRPRSSPTGGVGAGFGLLPTIRPSAIHGRGGAAMKMLFAIRNAVSGHKSLKASAWYFWY